MSLSKRDQEGMLGMSIVGFVLLSSSSDLVNYNRPVTMLPSPPSLFLRCRLPVRLPCSRASSRFCKIFVFKAYNTLPVRLLYSMTQSDRILQVLHRQTKDLLSETPCFCSRVRSRSCVSGSRWGSTSSRRVKGILHSEHQLEPGVHDDSFLRVLNRIC